MIVPPILAVPLLILWMMAATEDDSNIALKRSDVVQDESGARIWHGAMVNTTDSQYREIAVTIHFLDSADQPVGETSGRAARLEPGETLELRSTLPPAATGLRVHALEWRTGRKDKHVRLGPYAPWPFGHVQTEWP